MNYPFSEDSSHSSDNVVAEDLVVPPDPVVPPADFVVAEDPVVPSDPVVADDPPVVAEDPVVETFSPELRSVPHYILRYCYTTNHDTVTFKRSAASQYVVNGKTVKEVFAMAIGTNAFETLLNDPVFATKKKTLYDVGVLKQEIVRRSHFIKNETELWSQANTDPLARFRGEGPRPRAWKRADVDSFLLEFPLVLNTKDVTFIEKAIQKHKTLIANKETDETEKGKESNANVTYWQRQGFQNLGYRCRFIATITSNSMRSHFENRDSAALNRSEVDALTTDSATKSGWQHLAERFNDEQYVVQSAELSTEWGTFYSTSHDLSWSELSKHGCKKLVDGKEMKNKFNLMNNDLGKMYRKWSASGNGAGQLKSGTDSGGGVDAEMEGGVVNIDDLSTHDGDRIHFLRHFHPSTLYLWHQLLQHGMWDQAITSFPKDIAGEDNSYPSSVSTKDTATKRNDVAFETLQETKRMREGIQAQLKENASDAKISAKIATTVAEIDSMRSFLSKKEDRLVQLMGLGASLPGSAVEKMIERHQDEITKLSSELETLESTLQALKWQSENNNDKTPVRSNERNVRRRTGVDDGVPTQLQFEIERDGDNQQDDDSDLGII